MQISQQNKLTRSGIVMIKYIWNAEWEANHGPVSLTLNGQTAMLNMSSGGFPQCALEMKIAEETV